MELTENGMQAATQATQSVLDTTAKTVEAATRAFEQTTTLLKDEMTNATAGLEKVQADIKINMEKAMKTAEELVAFGQGNLEAFVKSGQIWAAGLQDLTKHVAATAQESFDESAASFKSLTATRSLREIVEIQTNLARAAMEKTMAESGKITDASVKLAEQVAAPLSARFSLAIETFGKSV